MRANGGIGCTKSIIQNDQASSRRESEENIFQQNGEDDTLFGKLSHLMGG
jgi:hypothetical protein